MQPRSLHFVATAGAGQQLTGSPSAMVERVCTDTRQVRPGDLFIALRGEKFDAHHFLPDAAARGAVAVVVERERLPIPVLPCATIAVEDTRQALGRLAACYRSQFTLPTVAVGGSNGKSTTKELIASVLCQRFSTLWSEASFNNDVGVPLTLLKLEPHHRAAVLEVGTNHPGELTPLVAMIQPQYGVVTSIGREHLEFFGDLNGVIQEEGWLAELLPASGRLFLNAENEFTECIARRARAGVVRVGFSLGSDWQAHSLRLDDTGASFTVKAPREEFCGEYRVNLLGRHQVINALLALAVGAELGVSREELQRGLAAAAPLKMRLQVWHAHGVRVLDDAYNANADSVLAALQTLQELPCAGRRIAVLGDMAELGEHTAEAHAEVGRRSAELRLDHLLAVGKNASVTAEAAREAGLAEALGFSDVAEAGKALKQMARQGDTVLLKASRASGLERLGEVLRANGR